MLCCRGPSTSCGNSLDQGSLDDVIGFANRPIWISGLIALLPCAAWMLVGFSQEVLILGYASSCCLALLAAALTAGELIGAGAAAAEVIKDK